jgi:prepilin-type N-terminal cleavage/methylation domain-containing protein
MNRRLGFTLIELLTVIAIIAILAAIIFPVYMRAKDSAYRNSDLSNMNALRSALQLYEADQGAYPPALLGYVTLYTSGPNTGNVIPANQLQSFLYPKRVDSVSTFQPAYDRVSLTTTTIAVWPNQDPRAVGTAPILDLNGDGAITDADDIADARQEYGPTSGYVAPVYAPYCGITDSQSSASAFYQVSGYDVAQVPAQAGGNQYEIHYALFWTVFGLGTYNSTADACQPAGSANDDPRQLGYANPPGNTVVTWDSYFRDYQGGSATPLREKRDIVLFLSGSARPYDSVDLYQRSWRILP